MTNGPDRMHDIESPRAILTMTSGRICSTRLGQVIEATGVVATPNCVKPAALSAWRHRFSRVATSDRALTSREA
jgi:hypothetical protein